MTTTPVGPSTDTPAAEPRPAFSWVYRLFMPIWALLMVGLMIGGPVWFELGLEWILLVALMYPVAVGVSRRRSRRAARAGRARAALAWDLLPMPWVAVGVAFVMWALS